MKKLLVMIIALIVFQGGVYAQSQASSPPWGDTMVLFYVTIGVVMVLSLLVLMVAFYVLRILRILTREAAMERARQQNKKFEEEPSMWATINQWLTRSTPIGKEDTIALDHSYDGIRELDNHLPPWWSALLYVSIVWGVIYLFVYHVTGSLPLSEEEYNNELAYAEARLLKTQGEEQQQVQIDESSVTLVTDAAALQDGEKTFNSLCASCHRLDGGGDIGPNLTDAYWKNGGSINDLFRVVTDGVPNTNMIPWSASLSPEKIQNVSSYILTSLQGTSPDNPKDPEGELYEPDKKTTDEADTPATDEADTPATDEASSVTAN